MLKNKIKIQIYEKKLHLSIFLFLYAKIGSNLANTEIIDKTESYKTKDEQSFYTEPIDNHEIEDLN